MSGGAGGRRAGWLWVLWTLVAAALALGRIPFDVEWFSIELTLRADSEHFWNALQRDLHPPFTAMLDRALGRLWPGAEPLHLLRVAESALALWLLAPVVHRLGDTPRWWAVACAFHPIVLFYAGAVRWYPLLLLAHAVRARAIHHDAPTSPRAGLLFVGGTALGSAAGYVDPLFVAHDLVWLGHRARERALPLHGLAPAAAGSIAVIAALHLASPLHGGTHALLPAHLLRWDLQATAAWALLGVAGETALPWPLTLTGVLALIACPWGLIRSWRDPQTRTMATWTLTYGLAWLAACQFGVSHPRYSLMLWLLVATALWPLLRAEGAGRVMAVAALAHLALGVALVVMQRGFFRADLNGIAAPVCVEMAELRDADLVIVPHPRLAMQIRDACELDLPVTQVPLVRIWNDAQQQLAGIAPRLRAARVVWMLQVTSTSSLAITRERIRRRLTRRCTRTRWQAFGAAPHADLKRTLSGTTARHRFAKERWDCDPSRPP
jgi:hypothetical protein